MPHRRSRSLLLAGLVLALIFPLYAAVADERVPAPIDSDSLGQALVHNERALMDEGAQGFAISGDSNAGGGLKDNAVVNAANWKRIDSANAGTGTQVIDSLNANGRNRISNDTVLAIAGAKELTHANLRSQVVNNSVTVKRQAGPVHSGLQITEQGRLSNFFGITVIAVEAGVNSSQNVSVNVAGAVAAGPID